MSSSIRSVVIGTVAAVLALSAIAASHAAPIAEPPSYRADMVDRSATIALSGSSIRNVSVGQHQFTIGSATLTKSLRGTTIMGTIVHSAPNRPDEQMLYTVQKSQGRVTSVDIKILRGGVESYSPKYSGFYVNRSFDSKLIPPLLATLSARLDSQWESAAELFVVAIALRGKDTSGLKLPKNPPQLPAAFPLANAWIPIVNPLAKK